MRVNVPEQSIGRGEATWKQWERILFEYEFPDYVIEHAGKHYDFDWDRMVRDLATRFGVEQKNR